MAIAELDKTYRQRIRYPELYIKPRSFGSDYLGYDVNSVYGTTEPKMIARVLLMFGYFNNSDTIQCQPWMGISFCPDVPLHNTAYRELEIKQRSNPVLSFDANSRELTTHTWSVYLGSSSEVAAKDHTLYMSYYNQENISHDQKLEAVAAATMPGQVLEDHIICANFVANGGTAVRIEDGNIHTLSLSR